MRLLFISAAKRAADTRLLLWAGLGGLGAARGCPALCSALLCSAALLCNPVVQPRSAALFWSAVPQPCSTALICNSVLQPCSAFPIPVPQPCSQPHSVSLLHSFALQPCFEAMLCSPSLRSCLTVLFWSPVLQPFSGALFHCLTLQPSFATPIVQPCCATLFCSPVPHPCFAASVRIPVPQPCSAVLLHIPILHPHSAAPLCTPHCSRAGCSSQARGCPWGTPSSDPKDSPRPQDVPWGIPSKPPGLLISGSCWDTQGTGHPACTGRKCCAQLSRSSSAAQQHCSTFTCGHREPGAENPCATKAVLPAESLPAGSPHPALLQLLVGPAQLGVLMKFMSQSERKKLFSADFTHHFLPAARLCWQPTYLPLERCPPPRPRYAPIAAPRALSTGAEFAHSLTRALSRCSLWLIKCQNKLPL